MPQKKEIKFEQPSQLLLLANKNITFIIIAIVVLILLGGYFFLFLPKIDTIKLIQEDNTAAENREERNKRVLENVALLRNKYLEIRDSRAEALDSLKKLIPDEPQVAELFLMMEKIALDNNFTLNNISVAAQEDDGTDKIKEANINFNVTYFVENSEEEIALDGNDNGALSMDNIDIQEEDEPLPAYDAFKQYLAALENNLRLMDINTVSFGSLPVAEDGGASPGSNTFTFSITTYFR